MPHIDERAKAWALELAGRVGKAVQARRKALRLTAQQLAARTAALGYPVTRIAITKIEGNKRAGKLDVAELFVLAVALEVPPSLLLFPNFPDGSVELVPEGHSHVEHAFNWLSGRAPAPWTISKKAKAAPSGADDGTELVAAAAERSQLDSSLLRVHVTGDEAARNRLSRKLLERYETEVELFNVKIEGFKARLWGESE